MSSTYIRTTSCTSITSTVVHRLRHSTGVRFLAPAARMLPSLGNARVVPMMGGTFPNGELSRQTTKFPLYGERTLAPSANRRVSNVTRHSRGTCTSLAAYINVVGRLHVRPLAGDVYTAGRIHARSLADLHDVHRWWAHMSIAGLDRVHERSGDVTSLAGVT